MTVRRYCLCGASFTGRSVPADFVEGVLETWWQSHQGEGHGETDARGAANARRRQDRADEARRRAER